MIVSGDSEFFQKVFMASGSDVQSCQPSLNSMPKGMRLLSDIYKPHVHLSGW